jgi:hypothetical protein
MIINPFLYKIELWQYGHKVDDVSDVLSLSINKEQNAISSMTFSRYVESDFFDKYTYNTMVIVYRRSMVYGIPPYKEFIGHIIDIDPIEDDNTAPIATIVCQGLTELLSRRRILYYQSSPYAMKEGLAETVVKDFVRENIGESANSANRFSDGKIPNFNIEVDLGRGIYVSGEDKSGQSLFDVTKDICDTSQLKFDITGNELGEFQFFIREKRIGRDLSTNGIQEDGTNYIGNIPVRFNFGVGNISKVTRKILGSNRLTSVTAYGQGSDDDRDIFTATKPASTGMDVREEVVNASNDEELGLNYVAYRRFMSQPVDIFDVDIVQVPGFIYGYNYGLGDLITLEYAGSHRNMVINSVNINIQQDGSEEVSITLEQESES